MADHARKQIRDAVETACTSLTTTGANVSSSRVYAHEDLPSLAIYTDNEAVAEQAGNKQWRDLLITVEARARAAATVDDVLDKICAEVETALAGSSAVAALATCTYVGVDIDFEGEGDQPLGLARMSFNLQYEVAETDPTTILI